MSAKLPNIFEYTDYRRYLEDYRNARRKVDAKFTHAYICTQLGQPNTRSFLSDIITGRKMVSSNFIDMIADLLELDINETRYFRSLVYYNQAVLPKDKDFYFEQVIRFKKAPLRILDKKAYKYYQNWYNGVIKEVLDLHDFKNDFSELPDILWPQITKEQVEESIKLMLELGLIAYNDEGFLKSTDAAISTEEGIPIQTIRQLQIQFLELGKQVIHSKDNITNKALFLNFNVSSEGLKQIIASLRRLKSEIASIVCNESNKSKKLYHLTVHLFSISK